MKMYRRTPVKVKQYWKIKKRKTSFDGNETPHMRKKYIETRCKSIVIGDIPQIKHFNLWIFPVEIGGSLFGEK
ncbi:hypothetical protein MSLAZ_0177 [Methanosarcina lacustris Z-7289]|uniref:Uncharacterized protein n=1 Tax=Methanosarcina lacustris Z-7289 TaxID=1434111 RepID=A0A0E3S3V7_9EURY|nr:hypothetical protein [Methanosarcina lacustris]AKB73438.1 hypothetical protein MSLAZ_0177 [Methanosarcina lacustris Z-7289]